MGCLSFLCGARQIKQDLDLGRTPGRPVPSAPPHPHYPNHHFSTPHYPQNQYGHTANKGYMNQQQGAYNQPYMTQQQGAYNQPYMNQYQGPYNRTYQPHGTYQQSAGRRHDGPGIGTTVAAGMAGAIAGNLLYDHAGNLIDAGQDMAGDVIGAAGDLAGGAIEGAGDLAEGALEGAGEIAEGGLNFLGGGMEAAGDVLGDVGGFLSGIDL